MRKLTIALVAISLLILQNCTSQDAYTGESKINKATIGAGIGALSGAVIGVLTGDSTKSTLIGAAAGGTLGAGAGYYMDRQEATLRQRLRNSGVSVSRIGNSIILNMPGNITFNTNQSDIKPAFYDTLNSVSIVLKEYDKTNVVVEGHTDSTGDAAYNQKLSQKRASSVATYIASQGILNSRLRAVGYGENSPVADNSTASGKAANRRVEIRLEPIS